MKSITLSDHTGDQLTAFQNAREADYQSRLEHYNKEVERIMGERKAKLEHRKRLLEESRYISWFFSLLGTIFREWLPSKPSNRYAISDQERILEAGNQGEKEIDTLFSSAPDNFVMLSGYKNYKGEIDRVLVCPLGVLTIEVKNRNGTIYVDGDSWYCDKYDRYGNLVERGITIQDKKGRSPSAQVNESSNVLEKFLGERYPQIKKVARSVFVTHERCKIGDVKNPTVNAIVHVGTVKWKGGMDTIMPNQNAPLDDRAVQEVVNLIKKDHSYHAKRDAERKRGNRR